MPDFLSPSITIRIAMITKIVLKNEPVITFPDDIIYIPPSLRPAVSKMLNVRIVMIVYHSSLGTNVQKESKKTAGKTMNVAMNT